MFLNCMSLSNCINSILEFINDNSALVGIITSVIIGSLWFRKYLREKRAEAFFGFYARLSMCLKTLQDELNERGRLNTKESDLGNIYTLVYFDNCIEDICPKFKKIDDKEMSVYANIAAELKQILIETDSNAYPRKSNRQEWYRSQYILYSFCEFLLNSNNRNITNDVNASNKKKHVVKCEALVKAIDYIVASIENSSY